MKTQTLPQSDGCKSGFSQQAKDTETLTGISVERCRRAWLTTEGSDGGRGYPEGHGRQHSPGRGREGPLSPGLGSAGRSPVGGTGVSGRAACGWAGGAREGCPWEVPHRGRSWQSASVCWEGALGWGPGAAAAHRGVPSRNTGLDSSRVPLAPSAGDA